MCARPGAAAAWRRRTSKKTLSASRWFYRRQDWTYTSTETFWDSFDWMLAENKCLIVLFSWRCIDKRTEMQSWRMHTNSPVLVAGSKMSVLLQRVTRWIGLLARLSGIELASLADRDKMEGNMLQSNWCTQKHVKLTLTRILTRVLTVT